MKKKSHKARKTYAHNPAPKKAKRRYKHNPAKHRSRRRYRSNPGSMDIKEIGIGVLSGAAGAILGPKVFTKLPVSPMIANAALLAVGAGLAYIGRKKPALLGLGSGMAISGISRMVVNAVPMLAGEGEMSPDQSSAVLATLATVPESEEVAGPFQGSFQGSFQGDAVTAM